MDIPCADYRQHHNRRIGFLGNFENAIVEGEQLAALASRTLGIYAYGYFSLCKQAGGLVNRFEGVSGIFPVNRHKAAFPDKPAENRNFEVVRFGDKSDLPRLQNVPGNNGVEVRLVVADKQDSSRSYGNFFYPGCMDSDAHDFQANGRYRIEQMPVKGAVGFVFLIWVYKKAAYNQKQNVQRSHPKNPKQYFPNQHGAAPF